MYRIMLNGVNIDTVAPGLYLPKPGDKVICQSGVFNCLSVEIMPGEDVAVSFVNVFVETIHE